jgi:hypothetical protein
LPRMIFKLNAAWDIHTLESVRTVHSAIEVMRGVRLFTDTECSRRVWCSSPRLMDIRTHSYILSALPNECHFISTGRSLDDS